MLNFNANAEIKLIVVLICALICAIDVNGLNLYADSTNTTFAMTFCKKLDAAVIGLRALELSQHKVGIASIEQDCVSFDVCSGALTANEWYHTNSTAFYTTHTAAGVADAFAYDKAYNFGALEFVRLPSGINLQSCSPDFDIWRKSNGVTIVCDEDTIKHITREDLPSTGCPDEAEYSLLDCIKPLQHDAKKHYLHKRSQTETMHFGTHTFNAVCQNQQNALAASLCSFIESAYAIELPQAGDLKTTSMIRWSFKTGYGCFEASDVPSSKQILTRVERPNKRVDCPAVTNGEPQRVDAYTCGFVCDVGYITSEDGSACIHKCSNYTTSCENGFYHDADDICTQDAQNYYKCYECDKHNGHHAQPWSSATGHECVWNQCPPGKFSSQSHACQNCAVNTISTTPGSTVCVSCNTSLTGLYASNTGMSTCSACLGHNSNADKSVCKDGQEFIKQNTEFFKVQTSFAKYNEDLESISLSNYIDEICVAGFACLPCIPGYKEIDRVCEACDFGSYQPNFGESNCFACAVGQNTTSVGSVNSAACVCKPGFE